MYGGGTLCRYLGILVLGNSPHSMVNINKTQLSFEKPTMGYK